MYLHGSGPPRGLLGGADGEAGVVATKEVARKEEGGDEGCAEEGEPLEAAEGTVGVGDALKTHLEGGGLGLQRRQERMSVVPQGQIGTEV